MLRIIYARIACIAVSAAVLAACSSTAQNAVVPQSPQTIAANAQHRSLSDFLAAQGSCITEQEIGPQDPSTGTIVDSNGCVLFVPHPPNFNGWGLAPSTPLCSGFTVAAVDYAGVVNNWLVQNGHASLGTTISGSVSETRNKDGTGQVIVNINTRNALAWGGCNTKEFNFVFATVFFGAKPDDVLAGATPGLANSQYRIVYNEPTVGAPFPDLVAVNFGLGGYSYVSQQFFSSASGPLTSAFKGVPDGTPGQMVIGQNGTFKTVGKAAADGFTAEFVNFLQK